MKYIKTLVVAVATFFATTALFAVEKTVTEKSQWNVTLAGGGSSSVKNTTTKFNTELSVGKTGKVILPVEAGVRQGFSYSGTDVVLSTHPYIDWTVLPMGNFQVAVGLNAGASYGNTPLVWSGGPEVVARLFLKQDVYLFGRTEYDAALSGRSNIRETGNDAFKFALGFGLRF